MKSEIRFQGIAASPGLAYGPAFIWKEQVTSVPRDSGRVPSEEQARLVAAIQLAKQELEALRKRLVSEGLEEEALVFEAHAMMLEDPALSQQVRDRLEEGTNAEAAWMDAVEALADQLAAIPDPTLSARSADLRDAGKRVLCLLLGIVREDRIRLLQPSVVLAKDLCPSETASLDKAMVLGFCTEEGGATSHTAILAKSLGIPAVVGVSSGLLDLVPGSQLLLDGDEGSVLANPSERSLERFRRGLAAQEARAAIDIASAGKPAITEDGRRVEVVANVGSLEDARKALEFGAEGIGLLRTEFLFIDRKVAPDEAEQAQSYAAILDVMASRPVVVRTIDVGGDKSIPYLGLKKEANPFLGYRAIRMCLEEVEFFKTQLRALLRAGAGHDLRIMFPMISSLDEVQRARELVTEVQQELARNEIAHCDRPQLGIMVEIPSAAVQADQFAAAVDFFSIGTNDLTQYTLAVDRTNPQVARLGDPCHPAVVRLIERVIQAGHEAGIWVGVCGEMAGDAQAIPILLGLGLDEFSMAGNLIPRAKSILRALQVSDAETVASKALLLQSPQQVRSAAQELLAVVGSHDE